MLDQYGRTIDYIRISVTDRCNLRCIYCMPEKGVEQVSHSDILSYAEIVRLCRIFVRLGIRHIKLTGGEPLVRKGLPDLAKEIRSIPGIEDVTLTTNGVLLGEQMKALYEAGIRSVNVSLDTLDGDMFQRITRRDLLDRVLEGLKECAGYPDVRLKINCVPLKGVNEEQWVKMAGIAREYPVDVRFIELMPIGFGREYHGETQESIQKRLKEAYGSPRMLTGNFGNGPSVYVAYPGFAGRIGFISAISHKFCSQCNRVRLTSEGYLKLCLQYTDGVDVRELLRGGKADEEIFQVLKEAIGQKPRDHQFTVRNGEHFEQHEMSRIGG